MSIRTRLLTLVFFAMLVPAIVVGVRFVQDRAAAVRAAQAELADVAQEIAADVDEKIQGTAQLQYGLARARDLDTRDRAACSAFLSAVREQHPQYTGILTIDPDGKLFCDSLRTGRDLDLNDRAYFVTAKTLREGVALQAAFGRLTGLAVLQIARPARTEDGALKFVLLASLNLTSLAESHRRRTPTAEILLIDKAGTVLVWGPGQRRAARLGTSLAGTGWARLAAAGAGAQVAEIAGADGSREIWAVAARSARFDTGFRVLVGRPRSELVAAADAAFAENMILLAVLSVVLFASVWALAELSIRRQVSRIAAMAAKLGKGELGARIPPPHPRGELGALMAILNDTAESLERQRAAIDALDRQLRQSQKMEAIGQLTGGIAHDFNNLLTVILGNAEMLAESVGDNRRLHGLAAMTVKAAERGAELTNRLLAFSRRQALDPKAIEINRLIAAMDGLLRRTLGEQVEIELVRGGGLWRALVDPGQLESALLNLCINARDAMPSGGRLTIETANIHLDAAYAASQPELEPGQYVMIAVSDTGLGMDAATLERAFEPFFTTKGVGKGSGLGLSMVYGFVKQSKGHIRLYSEPGHGTTVKLYLPRADAGEDAAEAARADAAVAGGTGKLLVVEDDDLVRENAAGMLSGLGYEVVTARNGPEALDILRRTGDFDLLFTDVVMPGGMNGRELADEARALWPELPVLFTSGYTENAIVHHGRLDRGVNLIPKPYRRQDLAAKIRAVLDRARTVKVG